MIDLTRLNGHPIVVNCDLIKFVEATPDTTLSLVSGDKLIVREAPDDVTARVSAFRARILSLAWPDAVAAIAATSARTPHQSPDQNPDRYELSSATE